MAEVRLIRLCFVAVSSGDITSAISAIDAEEKRTPRQQVRRIFGQVRGKNGPQDNGREFEDDIESLFGIPRQLRTLRNHLSGGFRKRNKDNPQDRHQYSQLQRSRQKTSRSTVPRTTTAGNICERCRNIWEGYREEEGEPRF